MRNRNNNSIRNNEIEYIDPIYSDEEHEEIEEEINNERIPVERIREKFRNSVNDTINDFLCDPNYCFGSHQNDDNAPYVSEIRGDPSKTKYVIIIDGLDDPDDSNKYKKAVKNGLGKSYAFEQITTNMQSHQQGVTMYTRASQPSIQWKNNTSWMKWGIQAAYTAVYYIVMLLIAVKIYFKYHELSFYFNEHETPLWHLYGAFLLEISSFLGLG